jgi:hypothetical protein
MKKIKLVCSIVAILVAVGWSRASANPTRPGAFVVSQATSCCVCEPYITDSGDLAMGCPCGRQFGGVGCNITALSCTTFGHCEAE